MNEHMYKLSPSDFRYLWEDCKHCFWRKVKLGIKLPSIGIPGIFGKMNGLVQTALLGKNLHDLHPDLPPGTFDRKERFLISKPIPNHGKAFISGRFDLLTKFEDGSHGVIDLKITDPKSESLPKFKNQLHAYKFALENPANEKDKMVERISRLGLLVMSPESVELAGGEIIFRAKPQWLPLTPTARGASRLEEGTDSFFSFIDEVTRFLDGPMPQPTESCDWCTYRKLTGEVTPRTEASTERSRPEGEEIPF